MKCTLVRFSTHGIASSLSEIVNIENIKISNQDDVDRGSDCMVRRAGKLYTWVKSNGLLICFTL